MTDSRSTTDEQARAQALEQLHELIIHSQQVSSDNASALVPPDAPLDSGLIPPDQVFDLIRRVRDAEDRSVADTAIADGTEILTSSPTRSVGQSAERPIVEADLPESLGRFEIIRQLGQGGYGIVFLAKDPDLQREVALKIPRHEALLTADLRARFVREAQAAAALEHPNIVQVHESGQVGLVCYIVSQYVPGETLAEHLEASDGPVRPTDAARLVADLASAIHHAHSHGVLHRDLKPANVLLDRSDHPDLLGTARITDFGLARTEENQSLLTATGAVIGTPAYMSPEQARGGKQPVGTAADIYSLGAMLYELLTKIPPFHGDSVIATLRAVVETEPVPPRHRNAEVPADLEAICLKCLHKLPEKRYPTALGLQDDLRRFLRGEPVQARPVSSFDRLIKWGRRNPALAMMGSATVVLTLVALVASLVGWRSTAAALSREKAALATAASQYERTKGAIDEYFVAVSENELMNAPGLKPLRKKLLATALQHYEDLIEAERSDPGLNDEIRESYYKVAMIRSELGELDASREAFQQALNLFEDLLVDEPENFAALHRKGKILRHLAGIDRSQNALPAALAAIDQAIEIHEGLIDGSHDVTDNSCQLGLLLSNRASIIHRQGDPAAALQLYTRAAELFRELHMAMPEKDEWAYRLSQMEGNRSIMLRQLGQIAESRELLDLATQLLRDLVERHPEQLRYLENFGKALANMSTYASIESDYQTAADYLDEASAAFDRLMAIHPQVLSFQSLAASTKRASGDALRQLDRFEEAETRLSESVRISEAVVSKRSDVPRFQLELTYARVQLGSVYRAQGDAQRAIASLELSNQEFEQLTNVSSGNIDMRMFWALCHEELGRAHAMCDRPEEALAHLEEGRIILETLLSELPNNPMANKLLATNDELTAEINDASPQPAETGL